MFLNYKQHVSPKRRFLPSWPRLSTRLTWILRLNNPKCNILTFKIVVIVILFSVFIQYSLFRVLFYFRFQGSLIFSLCSILVRFIPVPSRHKVLCVQFASLGSCGPASPLLPNVHILIRNCHFPVRGRNYVTHRQALKDFQDTSPWKNKNSIKQ
jgi:hypothetical protein